MRGCNMIPTSWDLHLTKEEFETFKDYNKSGIPYFEAKSDAEYVLVGTDIKLSIKIEEK